MGKPWEDAPDVWKNETAWCQWLRSQSRRVWSRHPIKNNYVKARMLPVDAVPADQWGEKFSLRTKMLCQCEMCAAYYPRNKMEVDHIEQAGSFKTMADYAGFIERLLVVGYDDIRLLCKGCHKKVTLGQRFGCSIEEAELRQKLADFKKLKVAAAKDVVRGLGLNVPFSKGDCLEVYEQYLRSGLVEPS